MPLNTMNPQTPISSECPKCHQERMVTYTGDELIELLREGAEIEA
jgi:hypothetical protein